MSTLRNGRGWRVVVVLACCTVASAAPSPKPPELTARVTVEFHPGSSGIVPTANGLVSTVELANTSARRWMVVPDVLSFESHETAAIGGALCTAGQQTARDQAVPYLVRTAPADLSGQASTLLLFPGGGDQITLSFPSFTAQWSVNDQPSLWQPTPLTRGKRLVCKWENLSPQTFKDEYKTQAPYRLNHLGPVVYDEAQAGGVAQVLVSTQRGTANAENTWRDTKPQWVPLTVDAIRARADDEAAPMMQRVAFLCWLWDQPRAPAGADAVLLDYLDRPGDEPLELRRAAARGLLARHHEPAYELLLGLALNREADKGLRTTVARCLDLIGTPAAFEAAARVARDDKDDEAVRRAALTCLTAFGDQGWAVIQTLTEDATIGKTAAQLITDRDKAAKD